MINKVILVGNVGADPEVRSLESGVKMARLRLATTERVFNRETNESREYTEWHTLILWRGLADVADRYIRKGSQVYVEGSLRTREWVDKDNIKHFTTEINVNELKMLGRRNNDSSSVAAAAPSGENHNTAPASAPIPSAEEDVDGLPF